MYNLSVELLKSFGLKATPQRIEILTAIESMGHANIDEIYEFAKKNNPTMSLATVYKNVTALVDKSILKEVSLNNFKSKYETTKEKHAHLVCRKCGNVKDISLNNNILVDSKIISKKEKFNAQEVELNIYGICNSCKEL